MQTSGISISTRLSPTASLPLEKIPLFENLAKLTRQSIRDEIDMCSREKEYSQVAAPWIPVKCYYRIYYLESILIYLLNGSTAGFSHGGHSGTRKSMRREINAGNIIFSNSTFSQNVLIKDARAHVVTSGANLSDSFYSTGDCVKSVRKKIGEYMELHFKEQHRITSYRTNASKALRDNFYNTSEVNLSDFFYWMRIKANYKDIDYLDFDNDITANDAFVYIREYAAAQDIYAFALEQAIEVLKVSRGMQATT
ncbi:MAG: hypothetical protein V4611_00340 [Patescibacteria group bacterium]